MTCLLLLAGGRAYGQDVRASLGGKVTDQTGASVAKATVTVTADETGVVQTTPTNSAGDWILTALLPGHYHFEVKAAGFKTEKRTSIELELGDVKYVDTKMQVGTATESVTVVARTPLIDLSSAVSGAVLTQTELEEYPSQNNAPTMDVAVLTGTQVSGGVGGGVFGWSTSALSDTTVNGVGYNGGAGIGALAYTLDGGTANNNTGQLAFEPPNDAVSEVRLVTNPYDASQGRGTAANEAISLKSGAEKFHGDLYENYQGSFLNAQSYANDTQMDINKTQIPRTPIHVNIYGGSVGGPVWIPKLYDGRKKKTFFFLTYTGTRNIQASDSGTATVPTALERAGDFSQSYTVSNGVQYPIQIFNPASTVLSGSTLGQRSPYSFPGCVMGTATASGNGASGFPEQTGAAYNTTTTCESLPSVDPIAANYFAHIPLPDLPPDLQISNSSGNFAKLGTQNDKFRGYTLRLDQTENNNNHSFISMGYNSFGETSLTDFGTNPQYEPLEAQNQFRQNRDITFDHVVALRSNLVLDLSYHVLNYVSTNYDAGGGISPTTYGFPASFVGQMQDPSIPEVGGITSNLAVTPGTDNLTYSPTDINQDINVRVSQTHNNHDFRYGFEYLIQQEGQRSLGASGGNFSFGANYTSAYGANQGPNPPLTGGGNAIADFDLGLPGSTSNIPTNVTLFYSARYTALYFQDDWRYTPKLTFSLGMRWDYERPTTERFNRIFSRYNATAPQTAATAAAMPGYTAVYGASGATNIGAALLQQWGPPPGAFQVIGGPEYAGVNGTPRGELNPRYKYFQPRLGFAYQIMNNTVLRGGVGRFVQADFNQTGSTTGFSSSTPYCPSACSNYDTVGQTWDTPFPGGLVAPTGSSLGLQTNIGNPTLTTTTPTFEAPNEGRIYVDNITFGVQKQISSYLFEVSGLFNRVNGLNNQGGNAKDINVPSAGAWFAANTPVFPTVGGLPDALLPGSTLEANPFKGVANINPTEFGAASEIAYQLLRPNPSAGDIYLNNGFGRDFYYALNTRVERRFHNGFSFRQSFAYSKKISEDDLYANQAVAVKIEKRIDTTDTRFNYTLYNVYELPFGKGKQFLGNSNRLVDEAVGGWEFSVIYHFLSGTPLTFPTNSAFFEGGDPKLANKTGPGPNQGTGKWFDTTKFAPFPGSSVTVANLSNPAMYPGWTGVLSLPGAGASPSGKVQNGVYNDFATWNTYNPTTFGDVRQPYITTFTVGLRKNFALAEGARFEARMDLFNALNHPTFSSINLTPGATTFGQFGTLSSLAQANSPRQVQLSGRFYF
jgi:hypothetical protein